jgi:cyclopropane-fatty-acyl-phospholipid synthase
MLFVKFLRPLLKSGTLTVIDHKGRRHVAGDGSAPRIAVRFHDPALGRKLFIDPALHAGEAYMNGTLTIEDGGDLYGLLDLVLAAIGTASRHWVARSMKSVERITNIVRTYNPLARASRNVAHHYDLSTALYRCFLDADMQYSCAYFRSADDSLEEAQRNKLDHLAVKLRLTPGMHVLDIGCGWGGLALHFWRAYGVGVTGVSLSQEQLRVANERVRAAGAEGAIELRYQDFRQITGTYDRIVSVGMFEHVGLGNYRRYFEAIHKLLKPEGIALVHTIGRADGPGMTDGFTHKYIFPGGYSPALSEIVPSIERAGLYITDIEVLRLHYARTLREWRQRFMAARAEMEALYDARFCRMWEFFLAASEAGFRHAFLVNFQIQLTPGLETLPPTRDYMYGR